MDLDGAREANSFASQSLDTRPERQVVTLNALSKYLARQMHLLRDFSGVTTPVVAGYHTNIERGKQRQ